MFIFGKIENGKSGVIFWFEEVAGVRLRLEKMFCFEYLSGLVDN